MRRTLFSGLVLAVAAALVVLVGQALGLELEHIALFGTAVGAILALVSTTNEVGKLAAFTGGFLITWITYALRASVLPDSSAGRALAVFCVIALVTAACALFEDAAPTWAGLLGVSSMAAAYEQSYTAAPSQFLRESPTAATSFLLAAAVGYVVLSIFSREDSRTTLHEERRRDDDEATTQLDDMLMGDHR